MKLYISGGAKNGKSFYAQKRAKEQADITGLPLYYIATMIPHDEEDEKRIARHIREREGWGFETIEKPLGLSELLASEEHSNADCLNIDCTGVFLIDSVTAILSNAMFPVDTAPYNSGDVSFGFDEMAAEKVAEDLLLFLEKVENAILVSDYIYADPINERAYNSSAANYTESAASDSDDSGFGNIDYTEVYRKGLAYVDRKLAAACDEVIEISAGIPIRHK